MLGQGPDGIVCDLDVVLAAQSVEADLLVNAAVQGGAEMLPDAAQQYRRIVLAILAIVPECVDRGDLARTLGAGPAPGILQFLVGLLDELIGLLELPPT